MAIRESLLLKSKPFLIAGMAIELLSIVITVASGYAVRNSEEKQIATRFEQVVERGMIVARNRLKNYELGLYAANGMFTKRDAVTRADWRNYVEQLDVDQRFPGINGIGFIRRVPSDGVDAFLENARADGIPDMTVRTLSEPPAGDRYIIEFIEPLERNRSALGLDIGSNSIRREAATEAMLTGQSRVTDIIALVQDNAHKPGFLMLVPVYEGGVVPDTEEERIANCVGWTYAPFVGETTMAGISDLANEHVSFAIYAGERHPDRRIFSELTAEQHAFEKERIVFIGGQEWRYVWASDEAFLQASSALQNSGWILLLGLSASTGLLIVMFLLHRSAARAVRIAENASTAKSDFLSVMSHEIRTPLHGVLGMSELMLHENLSESAREKAEVISGSGAGLLAIVNDILDYSRIERGDLVLEDVPFDPIQQAQDSVQLFQERATEKGIELQVEFPDRTRWMMGDPLRTRQILLNLLSNGIKFTSDGAVTIELAFEETQWTASVRDTGIGMSPEVQARLFSPFMQAESSTSRRFGGSGLGLSIVKRLIDAMQGAVRVASEPGAGTLIEVTLPARECPAPESNAQEPNANSQLGLNVLLAEDNPVNQSIAKMMLEKLGCQVSVASNGTQAIEAAAQDEFDVILMDWQMPEVDGIEATLKIKAAGNPTPVVALTANATPEGREICGDAGMVGFLTKPLSLEALRDELQRTTLRAKSALR